MKAKIFLILIISSLVISCSNKDSNKTVTVSPNTEISDSEYEESDDLSKKGFELWNTETIGKIKSGVAYDTIVKIYGEPTGVSEPMFSEVDGGTYMTADYDTLGVSITYSIENDSLKVVWDIEIVKPCKLKTLRDVGIGSTYEEVQVAYKDLTNKIGSDSLTIIVGSIYGGLVFNFDDNKVSRVFVGASAE